MRSLEDQALPSIAPTTQLQSDRVPIATLVGGGCEDEPSVQLSVVVDCSGPETAPDTTCR